MKTLLISNIINTPEFVGVLTDVDGSWLPELLIKWFGLIYDKVKG